MKYLLMGACFIFLLSVSAQECKFTLSGRVMDIHDGSPVAYASVKIKNSNIGAISDSLGFYKIDGLCSQTYNVVISHHIGCEPNNLMLQLQSDSVIDFNLEFHFLDYEGIEVSEMMVSKHPMVLRSLDLSKNLVVSGHSLGKQLEILPGVRSLNTGNNISKPIIHGLHSNRVLILNNGVRQEGQQWGSEHAPEIDPFLMNSVSVIKGARAVQYGSDAIAGVILLSPSPIDTNLRFKIDYNSAFNSNQRGIINFLASTHSSRKITGLYMRLHSTYKIQGNAQTPDYYLKNTGYREFNYAANIGIDRKKWKIDAFYSRFYSEIGILSGSHISNLTDLQNAYEADEPLEKAEFTYNIDRPRQLIFHDLFKLSSKFIISKNSDVALLIGRQVNDRSEFDRHKSYDDSISNLDLAALRLKLFTNSVDLFYRKDLFKNFEMKFGANLINQGNAYAGRYFVPNFIKQSVGGFTVFQLDIPTWLFETGFRYDYAQLNVYKYENDVLENFKHDFANPTFNVGITKVFSHHFIMRGNVSNAWRSPSINELYSEGLHHGSASIENGNRTISNEQCMSYSSSLEFKSKKMKFYLDVYHSNFSNFIYLSPTLENELTIQGAFPVFQYLETPLIMSGVDVQANVNVFRNFNIELSYAFVRAEIPKERKFIVGIPADKISMQIKYSKDFEKIKFTGVIEGIYVLEQKRVEFGSDFVAPPDAYLILNAQFGLSFYKMTNPLEIAITSENLANQVYRDYLNRYRYLMTSVEIFR